jgi:hypothetical protein
MTNYYFNVIANGVQLDTFDDEQVLVSNNATGLFDIDKLPSDFTRELTLPGSKRNNDFFKHAYDIDINAPFLFQESQKVECYIDISGYLLVQGYLQLNRINVVNDKIDTYDVSLYGRLSNFSRDLSQNLLTDLASLSDYNHEISHKNIIMSWSGSSYDGHPWPELAADYYFTSSVTGENLGGIILYPLVDYGKGYFFQASAQPGQYGIDTVDGQLTSQDFKPAIRLTAVVDKMFSEFGYSFESTFFSQSMFDNIYMLCDRGKQYAIFDDVDLETYGKVLIRPTSGSTTDILLNTSSYEQLVFDTIDSDPSFAMGDSGSYTLPIKSDLQGNIKLNFLVSGSLSGGNLGHPQLQVGMRSGSSGTFYDFDINEINRYLRETYSQLEAIGEKSYTLEETWVTDPPTNLPTGSYEFFAKYEITGSGDFSVTIAPDGNTESLIEVTQIDFAADYREMEIPQNMPFGESGITCLDFLKGLQKKFNLVITPSKTRVNHFEIETFNDWYKTGTVMDLSNNIKTDKTLSVTPANTLAVNELEFTDTLGKDYLGRNFNDLNNRIYGASTFRDRDNQFSQGKIDVTSVFSSSPLRYIEGTGTTEVEIPTLGYLQGITFNNSTTTICNDQRFIGTAYIASNRGYITFGDVLYWDIYLQNPLRGYAFVRDNGTGDVWGVNTFTGYVQYLQRNC